MVLNLQIRHGKDRSLHNLQFSRDSTRTTPLSMDLSSSVENVLENRTSMPLESIQLYNKNVQMAFLPARITPVFQDQLIAYQNERE